MKDQRQAIEDLVIKAQREADLEYLDRMQAACKKHATAALAKEEAEGQENTQAQDKEPRSIENSPRVDPVQKLVKLILGLQQQANSSREEGERCARYHACA